MVHHAGDAGMIGWTNAVDEAFAALPAVGTTAGTVAAGDDSRFTGGGGGTGVTVMVGPGIDLTGATDSTTAMQAKIYGAPTGALIEMLGNVVYRFSALILDGGKTLRGLGYTSERDQSDVFGDTKYQNNAYYSGTVLRSTATSGAAITYSPALATRPTEGGAFEGFILIGPGSGTAVGIQIGGPTIVNAVIRPNIRNVKVCNFATGVQMQNAEEGTFDLAVRGCATGVVIDNNTNNCDFRSLNLQLCTTGCTITIYCMGNAFHAPIVQHNTGTGFVVSGQSNTWYSPYTEDNGALAFDFVGGCSNTLVNPYVYGPPWGGIRVQGDAISTQILGFGSTVAPIEDNGVGTFILGNTANVTGTGTARSYIDTRNNKTVLPEIHMGDGVLCSEAGALVWYGGSATRTVIAPA